MAKKNFFKRLTSKTLYFPGCLTKSILKKEYENYKEIFNLLKIDYVLMNDKDFCCGLPAYNGGYKKETTKLAKKILDYLNEKNISKIITNCPSCYHTFKEIYPKLIRGWDIQVEHATQTIYNSLKKKNFKNMPKEKVTYHDPCHLGRYEKIYDEPRKVIEILGRQIIEMKYSKENALCCGGGGGVRANYESLAKNIAKKRVQDISEEISRIITPCGLCYSQLNEADPRTIEFSTFVLSRLKR
jgi:Fe-S oxidoreductase